MKKVNIKEKTEAYNRCRLQNLHKQMLKDELLNTLASFGITKCIVDLLIKYGEIKKEKNCLKQTLYYFSDKPLHMFVLEKYYKEKRNIAKKSYQKLHAKKDIKDLEVDQCSFADIDEALQILTDEGYLIYKCVGFDLDTFKLDHPDLYKEYLKYEKVEVSPKITTD